mmetsp:Transcript_60265/g.119504  ORF Transcript_60265/g.119504 Transcript_60265/m.119504 type:complete len:172 (+) Transcript_60265:120-635(+)
MDGRLRTRRMPERVTAPWRLLRGSRAQARRTCVGECESDCANGACEDDDCANGACGDDDCTNGACEDDESPNGCPSVPPEAALRRYKRGFWLGLGLSFSDLADGGCFTTHCPTRGQFCFSSSAARKPITPPWLSCVPMQETGMLDLGGLATRSASTNLVARSADASAAAVD